MTEKERSAVGGISDVDSSDAGSSTSAIRVKLDVWNFFDKTGHKTVKCKLCNKSYAYHGGTTNLHNHLNRVHCNEYKTKSKHDPSLDAFIAQSKCPTSRVKRITDLIADMVAQDPRPAALVEGRGFETLPKYIEPGCKVPTATHVAQVVRRKHEAGKRLFEEKQLNKFGDYNRHFD